MLGPEFAQSWEYLALAQFRQELELLAVVRCIGRNGRSGGLHGCIRINRLEGKIRTSPRIAAIVSDGSLPQRSVVVR